MKCLDVGGGRPNPFGKYAKWLKSVGNPWRYTPEDWISLNVNPETEPTYVADANHMPFKSDIFDFVRFYYFPSTELSLSTLEEVHRVLKVGGYVDIVTGREILLNRTFACDFISTFGETHIQGYSRYLGRKIRSG